MSPMISDSRSISQCTCLCLGRNCNFLSYSLPYASSSPPNTFSHFIPNFTDHDRSRLLLCKRLQTPSQVGAQFRIVQSVVPFSSPTSLSLLWRNSASYKSVKDFALNILLTIFNFPPPEIFFTLPWKERENTCSTRVRTRGVFLRQFRDIIMTFSSGDTVVVG
jgi:hypothetical protein